MSYQVNYQTQNTYFNPAPQKANAQGAIQRHQTQKTDSIEITSKEKESWFSKNWPAVLVGAGALTTGIILLARRKNKVKTTPTPDNKTSKLEPEPKKPISNKDEIDKIEKLIEKENQFQNDTLVLYDRYINIPKVTPEESVQFLEDKMVENIDLLNFTNKLEVSEPAREARALSGLMQNLLFSKINPKSPIISDVNEKLNDIYQCDLKGIEKLFNNIKNKELEDILKIDNKIINGIKDKDKYHKLREAEHRGIINKFSSTVEGLAENYLKPSYKYKDMDENNLRKLIKENKFIQAFLENPKNVATWNSTFYYYLPKDKQYSPSNIIGIRTREDYLKDIEEYNDKLKEIYDPKDLTQEGIKKRYDNLSDLNAKLKELKSEQ